MGLGPCCTEGSTKRVLKRKLPRKGIREPRNSRGLLLVQPFRILWPSVIRSQKYVRPRENKLLELPKSKRRQLLRSQHLRTTRHRKLSRRQLRMLPSPLQGLEQAMIAIMAIKNCLLKHNLNKACSQACLFFSYQ